jgi:hypothetical protein
MNALMLVLFLYFIQIVNSSRHLAFRNSFLRVIISNDYKKKNTFTTIKTILYNKIITAYYDISNHYFALSEDDKTLIEAIISLGY